MNNATNNHKIFALFHCFLVLSCVTTACHAKEWKILKGHTQQVVCVAISADNSMVASGDAGGMIRLWDVAKEKEVGVLEARFPIVSGVFFLNDGKTLLSASYVGRTSGYVGKLQWWDLKTKQLVREMVLDNGVGAVYAPKGKTIVTGTGKKDDDRLCVRDAQTGKEITFLPGTDHGSGAAACTPDGRIVATTSGKHTITVWNVPDKKPTVIPLDGGVISLALRPDGKGLVAYNFSAALTFIDLERQKIVKASERIGQGNIRSLIVTPDSKHVLVPWGYHVYCYDAQTGEKQQRFKVEHGVISMELSQDGTTLVAIDGKGYWIQVGKIGPSK